jgi:hypothetical protein
MEILSGEIMGRPKSFTPSRQDDYSRSHISLVIVRSVTGFVYCLS